VLDAPTFEIGDLVLVVEHYVWEFFGRIAGIDAKVIHVLPWRRWNNGNVYTTTDCDPKCLFKAFWTFLGPMARDDKNYWWIEQLVKPHCLGPSTAVPLLATNPTSTTLTVA